MFTLTKYLQHATCVWLLTVSCTLGLFQPWSVKQSDSKAIELTKADLFSLTGWDSKSVSVLGIRIGMTREQARASLQSYQYGLRDSSTPQTNNCQSERCQIYDARSLFVGVAVDFDGSSRVSGITVERIPQDATAAVRKIAITKQFHGRTYAFFYNYSTTLREKLLGHEYSVSSDEKYPEIKTYKYARLGLIVTINPSRFGPEKESDIYVTFVQPTKLESQNQSQK